MSNETEIVYGINPVVEVLRSSKLDPVCVFVAHGLRGPISRRVDSLARQRGVLIRTVSRRELERRCGSRHHQGVIAVVQSARQPEFESLFPPEPTDLLLVADQVQDPRNLGALLRSADFAGVKAVVIPRHGAAGNTPTVAKVSSGAAAHVPLIVVSNLSNALRRLQSSGYWCYGAAAAGGVSLFRLRFNRPAVIVVGAESSGLRPLVSRSCDELVTIPNYGTVESLNVANAASIVLMEVRRQEAMSPGHPNQC